MNARSRDETISRSPADEDFRARIDAFECELFSEKDPRIESFIPSDGIDCTFLIEELVHIEIEYRRTKGHAFSITDYSDRFPQIAGDPQILLRLRKTYAQFANRPPGDPRAIGEIATPTDIYPGSPSHELASSDLLIGRIFGPYEIMAKLGEGGMGTVYKARHRHLDKTVAVKVLSPQLIQKPNVVARFKREMKAVGQVEHPNIVRAMDAGEVEGSLYLTMEFVDGSDLQNLIKQRGPMAVASACKVLLQVAQAMVAAHQAGLVHRDLKPANLLLAKTGQIKVLDLGLARLALDQYGTTELTSAGQTFGTPDYMSPEQWDDAHAADPRADLYSLGCTLFFLLVGRAPYATEKYNSVTTKMKGHVVDPIPDLRAACPIELPDAVVQIYERLMAKAPKDRLQSATELVEALAPLASEPVSEDTVANDAALGVKTGASATHRMSFVWLTASAVLLSLVLLFNSRRPNTPPLWFPAQLQEFGFIASKDSQRCRIRDRMFETQLTRTIAGKEVLFHLVPEFEIPNKDRKVRTFYIMESPVTNAMFNLFATENPDFEMVDREEETQRTWKSANDQPVTNVHPLEAQKFAQWLVPDFASLPTTTEWDLASGYYDFVDLLKDKAKSRLPSDVMLVGKNDYTGVKFTVGSGPGVGEFQAAGKLDASKNRSPYGCSYPSRVETDLFEFGEMTATVSDVMPGVENLREWTTDFRNVILDELLSTARSPLRTSITRNKDFRWIIPEGDEKEGLCMTVEDLDDKCGALYLNTSHGGVGFNRNVGFRVILLTTSLGKPGQL